MKRFFLIWVVMFLVGCATASGPIFTPAVAQEGRSLVYIYRKPTMVGAGNPMVPSVFLNNERIGKIRIGGYYPVEVNPGKVTAHITTTAFFVESKPTSKVEFEIKPNQTMYLRFSQHITGFSTYGGTTVANGKTNFLLVPEEVGTTEILKAKKLEREK